VKVMTPEILCQMPFLLQPSQLTQAWDWQQSIQVHKQINLSHTVQGLTYHMQMCP